MEKEIYQKELIKKAMELQKSTEKMASEKISLETALLIEVLDQVYSVDATVELYQSEPIEIKGFIEN